MYVTVLRSCHRSDGEHASQLAAIQPLHAAALLPLQRDLTAFHLYAVRGWLVLFVPVELCMQRAVMWSAARTVEEWKRLTRREAAVLFRFDRVGRCGDKGGGSGLSGLARLGRQLLEESSEGRRVGRPC